MRLLASALVLVALPSFHVSVQPLPAPVRAEVAGAWHAGCPVPLSGLRLLTVGYWGFDGAVHSGQLVVNAGAAPKLAKVFRRLYELRFPIHHMALANAYGADHPADGDVSAAFACRQAVPSPCVGGTGTGPLVGARLRRGGRPQPGREPLRRLRDDARQAGALLPRPLTGAARDGHAGGRAGVRGRGVGLGRLVDGVDEGLHALLQRTRPLQLAAADRG